MAKDVSDDPPLSTKGWTVDGLVALGPRMRHIPRISASIAQGELEAYIREHEESGTPLIVEGWHKTDFWPGEKLFGMDWLLEHGDESAFRRLLLLVALCLS